MNSADRAKERLIEEGKRARRDAELMATGQQIAEGVMLEAKVEKQADEIKRLTDELASKEANNAEREKAPLCPLMSGMILVPPRSDLYPSRLRFERAACVESDCRWWVLGKDDDRDCAVAVIARAGK